MSDFLYFIGFCLHPPPSGKQLDRLFDADRNGAGHGHLLPGWGGSGETLFQSFFTRFGCLSTPILCITGPFQVGGWISIWFNIITVAFLALFDIPGIGRLLIGA